MTINHLLQISHSTEETLALGEELGRKLLGNEMILLTGPLGAGKSVFARGVARSLGSEDWRGSPTFNLIHEYPTDPTLYHVDLYRLEPAEVEQLGLDEYARRDAVLLVEWADRAPGYLESIAEGEVIGVRIEYETGEDRLIEIGKTSYLGEAE